MSAEFVDTNVFIYAHEADAGAKREKSIELVNRLAGERIGAISTQVLAEFYATATKKLRIASDEAESVIRDLGVWHIHRPSHADLLKASRLHRQHRIPWRDALIVTSALELGCSVLWSEDMSSGQSFGDLMVRNPFR